MANKTRKDKIRFQVRELPHIWANQPGKEATSSNLIENTTYPYNRSKRSGFAYEINVEEDAFYGYGRKLAYVDRENKNLFILDEIDKGWGGGMHLLTFKQAFYNHNYNIIDLRWDNLITKNRDTIKLDTLTSLPTKENREIWEYQICLLQCIKIHSHLEQLHKVTRGREKYNNYSYIIFRGEVKALNKIINQFNISDDTLNIFIDDIKSYYGSWLGWNKIYKDFTLYGSIKSYTRYTKFSNKDKEILERKNWEHKYMYGLGIKPERRKHIYYNETEQFEKKVEEAR
jgi:hypothetical protein